MLLGTLLLAQSVTLPAVEPAKPSTRPNIVYILLDDAGYGDFGCYGQKILRTPNVDRLAREGMMFLRHYAGSTVCAPSRCVLMTGLHTGHCRVRTNGRASIPGSDLTVPRLLNDAGYQTACIGKYGLGSPLPPDDPKMKGFDYFFGYVETADAHNCYPPSLFRNGMKVLLDNRQACHGVASAAGRKQWAPRLFSEEVQRYLGERAKDKGKPFFLYYALNLPHANNEAGKTSPLGHGMETPNYGEFASRDWPDVEKGFASVMTFIDGEVGMVLAKLKALGLDENTVVMLSSDNGPHAEGGHHVAFFKSNGGLAGMKRDLTEGGVRVPFIVRWPGRIKPGTVSGQVCGFQDFLPTVAELAGVKVVAECDGISFLPTLLGNAADQKQHPYLCWHFNEQGGKRSVLQWPWKLIQLNTASPNPSTRLFNLDNDPAESRDVATQNPERVLELEAILRQSCRDP